MERETLLDKAKISAPAATVIVVTLIGAMSWFLKEVPTVKDLDDAAAARAKIVQWVKDLDGEQKKDIASLETRIDERFSREHGDVMRRLEIIDGDVKTILSRLSNQRVVVGR